MCGRFSLFAPQDDLEDRFDASFEYPYERRYNAAPGQALPVITDERPAGIRAYEWGLVPLWADEPADVGDLINARGEAVAGKPSFSRSFAGADDAEPTEEAAGRCLVLADGFYEWGDTDGGGRRPYRIARADGEPFAMAGLWTRWRPAVAQSGLDTYAEGHGGQPDLRETFTIVTTDANETVCEIHDRMPVILGPDDERDWLTAPSTDARALLEPAPDEWLRAYPVPRTVNDPSNDSPAVVEEVDA